MKIPQNIITKYSLYETNEQLGQSFMNGLKVYKSTRPDIEHLRFAECDIHGNPTSYIAIMNVQEKKIIQVTTEFMNDIAFEAMLNEAL
jgi:hypothetical protein